ncbi:MAG TPA: hypothetical protein VEA69_22920 [Tepidisphaeraceae bacterium]|nr:hypothetical protein [Tepidisphaeraceae bacterium]
MALQLGFDKGVTVNGFGGVCIVDWQFTDAVDLIDVTCTGHNGQQALLAGIKRGSCNFTLNYDSNLGLFIEAGQLLVISFYTGGPVITKQFRIERVNWRSAVGGVVTVNVDGRTSLT